jgi:hypothetical protein
MEQATTQANQGLSSNSVVPQTVQRKHSGLGIASFCICIGIGIIKILLFLILIPLDITKYFYVDFVLLIYLFPLYPLISILLSLVALGLGIGGLIQKDRKKIFSILGTIISAVTTIYLTSVYLIVWYGMNFG